MPRAATPSSRSRRSARQTKSAHSKRPVSAVPQGTVKGVKGEPNEATLDDAQLTITIPSRSKPPPILLNRRRPWKHPDELEYIKPDDWDEDQIIGYLCKNGFSIPPRLSHAQSPWCEITDRNGDITIVPRGYRLPLMFAAKFQWESLRLVMTSATRNEEWDDYKFDILHVSRLCNGFMEQARTAMSMSGMDKSWRCPMFDRALTRYYRRWLVNREEFVRDFWLEYKEEEYERDILKGDWMRFVQKGHKGFSLTRDEINNGITFEELTHGLSFIRGRLNWEANPKSGGSRNPSQATETTLEKREATKHPHPSPDSDNTRLQDSSVEPSISPVPHEAAATSIKVDALSPAVITVKLEQMVDDPSFFRPSSSDDHEVIQIPSTPDYYPSPVTDTGKQKTDDPTTTAKSIDFEPTCTRTNNPNDLYVSNVSRKVVEPMPIVEDLISSTWSEPTPRSESPMVSFDWLPPLPALDNVSSADVVIPGGGATAGVDNGVSVEIPAVGPSPDVEMGSLEETPPPQEEKQDNAMDQDPSPSPRHDNPMPPPKEGPAPHHPLFPPRIFEILTPPGGFIMNGLTGRTVSVEPQQNEPTPLPDGETHPATFQSSRSQARSENSQPPSQPPSRPFKEPSEQPSTPDKKLNAWDARVYAALQRAQKLTKPSRQQSGDKGAEGIDEPARRRPSMEAEPRAINLSLQRPVELSRREGTPRAQSPTPSGSSNVVPASSFTVVSPGGSMGARSAVAIGKSRQLEAEPLVEREQVQEQIRERQGSVEQVQEPASPMGMDLDRVDVEPTSISHAPRARSRSRESSGHAFVDPNMSLSSVSTYRRDSLSGEDLGLSHQSSPVVRQVVSMFRETLEGLSGILDSVERGTTISPTVYSRHFMSASASASASSSSMLDSSLVGELLDEIRGLKRQMQEHADRRSDRDLEVLQLQSQVDDLRRHVRMDSQSRMSVDIEDEPKARESLSSLYSSSSSPIRRRLLEPDPSPAPSPHPLAHLLSLDLEDPNSSWSTPDISTPTPCSKPSSPHDDVPLPIKSQRKHRMMFFPPPKQP